jgi:hypothetical protein
MSGTSSRAFYDYNLGNLPDQGGQSHSFRPSVQAQMTALKITSIQVSGMNYDLPWIGPDLDRRTMRYVVGANGKFDAMDTNMEVERLLAEGRFAHQLQRTRRHAQNPALERDRRGAQCQRRHRLPLHPDQSQRRLRAV